MVRTLVPSLLLFATSFFIIPLSQAQNSVQADHVQVSLFSISSTDYGVHYKIEKDWHIYWKNPGDSGAAPKFEIEGAVLKKIYWPAPHRIPVSDLTNYGYDSEVVIPLEIQSDNAEPELVFELEWLVCKVECVPGFATFKIKPSEAQASDEQKKLYNHFLNRVPKKTESWTADYLRTENSEYVFRLSPPQSTETSTVQNIHIFPADGTKFKTANPKVEILEKDYEVAVPLAANANAQSSGSDEFAATVQYQDGSEDFFEFEIKTQTQNNWLMGLLLAFLGGVILNLMPCVFPVLSLKALSFLSHEKNSIRSSSWQYTFGVLTSFVLIGALLTGLRLSGQNLGWGFQLQNSALVFLLIALFSLMALHFWGFFDGEDAFAQTANRLAQNRFFSTHFGTGVLAVLVASPCTAPFMGSALGLTLLLPAYQSLLIFFALGAGLAAPILALAYSPFLIKRLPRPGPWMETFKKFMAFPLAFTALWLAWVLDQQRSESAGVLALVFIVLLCFFSWIYRDARRTAVKGAAILFALLTLAAGTRYVSRLALTDLDTSSSASSLWQPYSKTEVQRRVGVDSIFIDFTASWCITCQVNKKNVLSTSEIEKLFEQNSVYLVRADWTNQNPDITQALAAFGRNSVPLYVFYSKDGKAKVLPEILTKETIKQLFLKGE